MVICPPLQWILSQELLSTGWVQTTVSCSLLYHHYLTHTMHLLVRLLLREGGVHWNHLPGKVQCTHNHIKLPVVMVIVCVCSEMWVSRQETSSSLTSLSVYVGGQCPLWNVGVQTDKVFSHFSLSLSLCVCGCTMSDWALTFVRFPVSGLFQPLRRNQLMIFMTKPNRYSNACWWMCAGGLPAELKSLYVGSVFRLTICVLQAILGQTHARDMRG